MTEILEPLISCVIVSFNRRDELLRCIRSLFDSSYKSIEVIVVDNASTDGTAGALGTHFGSRIRLVENSVNVMAAEGRNIGARFAEGDMLLFVDSDNVVDPEMIAALLGAFRASPATAMAGPLMYYWEDKGRIWWAGADINLWTSLTTYHGNLPESDERNQSAEPLEVGHIPNVFMCRRSAYEGVGGIEPSYGIMYEESDLAEKLRRAGHRIVMVPRAVTYHDVPTAVEGLRSWGLQSRMRAYLVARNRLIYMRRNASRAQYLFFVVFFIPVFTAYYSLRILTHRRWDILGSYLRGVWDGLIGQTVPFADLVGRRA